MKKIDLEVSITPWSSRRKGEHYLKVGRDGVIETERILGKTETAEWSGKLNRLAREAKRAGKDAR